MPSLKLFRRDADRPTLRQRGADLKATAARLIRKPYHLPSPLPAAGSDEAVAAWRAACSEFDRLTQTTTAQFAALRIGDTFTFWTTDWVEAAQRGDFSRFSTQERDAARELTRSDLADLLVLTTRRDLQFAEARRRAGIDTLFALAYPNGEDPAEEPDPAEDYAHVAIAEHRAAYAAWWPFGEAYNDAVGEAFEAARAAQAEPHAAEVEAFKALVGTVATTPAGLVALAGYLPEAVREANCVGPEEDARVALSSMCRGVLALLGPEADAELVALEAEFLATDAAFNDAAEALNQAQEARAASNSDALKAAYETTGTARNAVLQRIRETTARGLAGLAVKARIAVSMATIDDPKAHAAERFDSADSEGLLYDLAGDVLAATGGIPDTFQKWG